MGKVIVLDFDGVIADSINECFLISYWAYKGVEKIKPDMLNIDDVLAKELFTKFRYLVGPGHEYYFLLKTIYGNLGRSNDGFLDLYKKNRKTYQHEARAFCERFFRIRKHVQTHLLGQWLRLNPLYQGIDKVIKKALLKNVVFIASTKDEASVNLLLKEKGLDISPENILGKSFSLNKREQLEEIIRRSGERTENVYFVDDNLTYLIRVRSLGINCFLASWGYNTLDVRQEAERLKIKSLTIQGLEEMVARCE